MVQLMVPACRHHPLLMVSPRTIHQKDKRQNNVLLGYYSEISETLKPLVCNYISKSFQTSPSGTPSYNPPKRQETKHFWNLAETGGDHPLLMVFPRTIQRQNNVTLLPVISSRVKLNFKKSPPPSPDGLPSYNLPKRLETKQCHLPALRFLRLLNHNSVYLYFKKLSDISWWTSLVQSNNTIWDGGSTAP